MQRNFTLIAVKLNKNNRPSKRIVVLDSYEERSSAIDDIERGTFAPEDPKTEAIALYRINGKKEQLDTIFTADMIGNGANDAPVEPTEAAPVVTPETADQDLSAQVAELVEAGQPVYYTVGKSDTLWRAMPEGRIEKRSPEGYAEDGSAKWLPQRKADFADMVHLIVTGARGRTYLPDTAEEAAA